MLAGPEVMRFSDIQAASSGPYWSCGGWGGGAGEPVGQGRHGASAGVGPRDTPGAGHAVRQRSCRHLTTLPQLFLPQPFLHLCISTLPSSCAPDPSPLLYPVLVLSSFSQNHTPTLTPPNSSTLYSPFPCPLYTPSPPSPSLLQRLLHSHGPHSSHPRGAVVAYYPWPAPPRRLSTRTRRSGAPDASGRDAEGKKKRI